MKDWMLKQAILNTAKRKRYIGLYDVREIVRQESRARHLLKELVREGRLSQSRNGGFIYQSPPKLMIHTQT